MFELGLNAVMPRLGRHLLAYAFAINFLFGSFSALNELKLTFFFYYPRTIRIIIFDPLIDLFVWISSALFVAAILVTARPDNIKKMIAQGGVGILTAVLGLTVLATTGWNLAWLSVYSLFLIAIVDLALLVSFEDRIFERPAKSLITLTCVYLLAFLSFVEIPAAVHYSLQSFDVNTLIGQQDAATEMQMAYASYGLIPWLYVAFLFSWAWVPVVQRLLRLSGKFFPRNRLNPRLTQPPPVVSSGIEKASIRKQLSSTLEPKLFLALAIAVFIGYYPYFQNPPWVVGTDAYWRYYDPLTKMIGKGPMAAFIQALTQWQPVPLMILYVSHVVTGMSLLNTLRLTQLMLVLVLGIFSWLFLTHNGGLNFGLNAFLLSALSITTTIGFYTGIIANWMALAVWFVFFGYLSLRSARKLGYGDLVVMLALSILILFIHPWTWVVFASTVVIAALVALARDRRRGLRTGVFFLSVIAIDCVVAIGTIDYLSASQGLRVLSALQYSTFAIRNPSHILWFWSALTWLTRIWSPFFNPLYIAIAIVGMFTLRTSTLTPRTKRLILGWLVVSAIGSLLIAPFDFNPADPSHSQSELFRLLYMTPFPVLAPLGITWLSQKVRSARPTVEEINREGKTETRRRSVWFVLIVLVGSGLAWASMLQRLLLIPLLPAITFALLDENNEPDFLGNLVLVVFLLVAFNSTARALSSLLRDPHNYRPSLT
jgi:hypothetical protein